LLQSANLIAMFKEKHRSKRQKVANSTIQHHYYPVAPTFSKPTAPTTSSHNALLPDDHASADALLDPATTSPSQEPKIEVRAARKRYTHSASTVLNDGVLYRYFHLVLHRISPSWLGFRFVMNTDSI
jgi:hypothetical protein